jgi:hypothetical protein
MLLGIFLLMCAPSKFSRFDCIQQHNLLISNDVFPRLLLRYLIFVKSILLWCLQVEWNRGWLAGGWLDHREMGGGLMWWDKLSGLLFVGVCSGL